jgi:hypothetical protein
VPFLIAVAALHAEAQTRHPNPGYLSVLKRVGLVLIVVGVLDIGLMIYCIYNRENYASSFNIFAVIAGIFLFRGSLRAARIVAWYAAFMMTAFAGILLILIPFGGPLDLWVTAMRLYPAASLEAGIFILAAITIPTWVYLNLRSEAILQERQGRGLGTRRPWLAFICGARMVVAAWAAVISVWLSGIPEKAIEIARSEYGDSYQYHVTGIRSSNGVTHVQVAAFNDHEIKTVRVQLPR